MAIKLYRCSNMWVKIGAHPCWKVQKALDEQGIPYEVVKGPFRRGQRDDLQRLSGQRQYPVIQFEDGSIYREESGAMAATIRAGQLDSKRHTGPAEGSPAAGAGPDAATAPPPQPSVAPPEQPHEDIPPQPAAEPPLEPHETPPDPPHVT